MALNTREPSNCNLQQSLCQWKQWITDIQPGTSCGSTLDVSPMCHATWLLPWWDSMFRKCVKSHGRHPSIPASSPCPWVYFESFLLPTTLSLASSLGVLLEGTGRKNHWENWKKKKKYNIPSVCMCGLQALRIGVSLKNSLFQCNKVHYPQKGRQLLCYLCNFHALKQGKQQKRWNPTQFLRYKRKIVPNTWIWMNNPGHGYPKHLLLGCCHQSPPDPSTALVISKRE